MRKHGQRVRGKKNFPLFPLHILYAHAPNKSTREVQRHLSRTNSQSGKIERVQPWEMSVLYKKKALCDTFRHVLCGTLNGKSSVVGFTVHTQTCK